jgi:hypothetical protein
MEIIDINSNRKARKEYICDWCGGIIKKKELYDWQKIASDDHRIYEWRVHKRCVIVANEYDMFDDFEDGLLTQGSFADRVFDIYSETHNYNPDANLDLPEQVLILFEELTAANS